MSEDSSGNNTGSTNEDGSENKPPEAIAIHVVTSKSPHHTRIIIGEE